MKSSLIGRVAVVLVGLLVAMFSARAGRPFRCCDYNGDKVAIVSADGKLEWEIVARQPQDCWLLPNGNILFAHAGGAREVTRAKATANPGRRPCGSACRA